jgi:hypothetical protein
MIMILTRVMIEVQNPIPDFIAILTTLNKYITFNSVQQFVSIGQLAPFIAAAMQHIDLPALRFRKF